MCGICGIYSKGSEKINRGTVVKMRDVMINRGPDDAGVHIAPHIGLGHRRLSIIDITSAGHQPISNEDGTIWLVCNGEIYNFFELRNKLIEKGHVFRSQADIEVLIHGYEEWGLENLLQETNGMFAFAIWDSIREELILVRDRLGVKPLFYMEKDGRVFFSSDIKSIWLGYDKDLTLNYKAIDHFLYASCIPQEYSIFKEVKKVLPAHYVKFNKYRTLVKNYWFLDFKIKEKRNEEELVEEVKERLLLAVKKRMISDVSLGAFLSGGVDSSLMVALMATMSDSPVKTFSIGFKEDSYNELNYAKMVADKYSTEHHEFIVEPALISIIPDIIWSYGEPFADSSQIPTYYVAKMTRKHVKVALTGDGGDESFCGYANAKAYYYSSYYRKYLPSFLSSKLLPLFLNAFVSTSKAGSRGIVGKIKTMTEYGSGKFENGLKFRGIFGFDRREKLYSPEFKQKLLGHDPNDINAKYITSTDAIEYIDKALYVDIKTRLPDDFLTKVDVATMMNSLEARSPFLDYELIEFAARIPSNIKLKHGRQKYLLKKIASNYLPHDAIYRKKQGFSIPIGFWFRDNFSLLIKEILLSDRAAKRGYFEMDNIKSLLEEHLTGTYDHTRRLWALICLELWHMMFIDKVITAKTNFSEIL
ncbi:MAG: asparagine synthase (glutamine-hydrolyzing) [Candidatus Scalinduaceae bacterium]